MIHQESYIELIDAYLCGRLSEEARSSLEAKILSDSALAEQVEVQRLQLQGLELLLEDDLREKMATWDHTKQKIKQRRIGWGIMISVAALGLGLFWITKNSKHKTPVEVKQSPPLQKPTPQDSIPATPVDSNIQQPQTPNFKNNLKSKSEPIALLEFKPDIQTDLIDLYKTVERGVEDDSLTQTLVVLLTKNALDSAQELLLQQSKISPRDFITPFSMATLDLLRGHYASAVQSFEALRQKGPSALTDRVEWYLALAYLANDQDKQAKSVLQKIAKDQGNDFQYRAQRILERH